MYVRTSCVCKCYVASRALWWFKYSGSIKFFRTSLENATLASSFSVFTVQLHVLLHPFQSFSHSSSSPLTFPWGALGYLSLLPLKPNIAQRVVFSKVHKRISCEYKSLCNSTKGNYVSTKEQLQHTLVWGESCMRFTIIALFQLWLYIMNSDKLHIIILSLLYLSFFYTWGTFTICNRSTWYSAVLVLCNVSFYHFGLFLNHKINLQKKMRMKR